MKFKSIVMVALLAALTILSAGCKKHTFRAMGPIRFSVSSVASETKSAYSGDVIGEQKPIERIDWIPGDELAIFMAWGVSDIDGYVIRDYSVGSVSTDGAISKATVNPVAEALEWQEGDDLMYTFGALYPSPSVSEFVEGKWENEIDLYNLTLTYPAVQELTPKGATGADALTLLPDMKYAYMFAFPIGEQPASQEVKLSLSPMFNAYEISISAGDNDEVNLTQFRLVSNRDDQPLACVRNLYTDDSHGESTSITVDLTGIKLVRGGDPLVLTVFSYADAFGEISLEFTGNEIGTRKLDMKKDGEWIIFGAAKKHKITGLYFPKLDEGGASGQGINWNGADGEDLNWNGAEGEDINWGGNKPYVLPGKFSVSETKQVQFSRGNLVYKAGEWDFHKQQYDRCFKESGTIEFSETATFDLFSWATAGIAAADNTMVNYQPWSFNDSKISGQEDTNAYGFGPSIGNVPPHTSWDRYSEYCDWGNNYTLSSKLGQGWYTLSGEEWKYLFQTREASTLNGRENARYMNATVYNLPGIILFSDDFATRFAGDQGIFTAEDINRDADFSGTVLSLGEWRAAESAGAVFLTHAGLRRDNYVSIESPAGGMFGLYWTSTANDAENAMVVGSVGPGIFTGEGWGVARYVGLAVRLVKLAE